MALNEGLQLTDDQWTSVAVALAAGDSWAQIAFKIGQKAGPLKTAGQKRGLRKGEKPQVQFVSMGPTASVFLQDEPSLIHFDPTDPERCLIGVREKLIAVVNGIEKTILEPEDEAQYMAGHDPVSRFAQHAKQEGYGVREYVSILKDIAKLATAHMPYRHATLSAIAIKDVDKSNGIKALTREDKKKRLTQLLEQAGIVDV